jgi:hypothetical protein
MAPPSLAMSSFLSKFRRRSPEKQPEKQPTSPPLPRTPSTIVPRKPCPHLSYWKIKSHDREDLIERITPYMACSLRKEQLLESIMEKKPWVQELIRPELAEKDALDDGSMQFREMSVAFWKGPEGMVGEMLDVARCYFYMLLRYTYRTRYWDGREKSLLGLELRDLGDDDFVSRLTEDEIYKLTRLPNRYGATYYRDSYNDTKQRLGWIRFCTKVVSFCQSVGLRILSDNVEHILEDLRRGLPRIISDQKLENVARHSHRNFNMARKTDKNLQKLSQQVTSSAAHSTRIMGELQEEMGDMSQRIDEVAAMSNTTDVKKLRQDIKTLKKDVKRLDSQTPSGLAPSEVLAIEVEQEVHDVQHRMNHLERPSSPANLKQEIEFARRELDELSTISTSPSQHPESKDEQPTTSPHENTNDEVERILAEEKAVYEQRILTLQTELSHLRLKDTLDSCRELMEKLLPDWPVSPAPISSSNSPTKSKSPFKPKPKGTWKPRGNEYGKRWRELFFAPEWKRCKAERPAGHPLLPLVDEQKYYSIGEQLYGTLSERFHNHQDYRDKGLSDEVLRVVFAVLPRDWEEVRRWDLGTEKRRWGILN